MGNLSILVIDPRPSFSSPTSTSSAPSFCVAAASDADEPVGMFGDHDENVVDPIVPEMETKAEAGAGAELDDVVAQPEKRNTLNTLLRVG